MGSAFADSSSIVLVSTIKGMLFVSITSVLLYGLMLSLLRKRALPEAPPVTLMSIYRTVVWLALTITIITAAAILYTLRQTEREEGARLDAVADLKVQQISMRLQELLSDARFLQANIYDELRHHSGNFITGDEKKHYSTHLESFRLTFKNTINGAYMVDRQFNILAASEGPHVTISQEFHESIGRAVSKSIPSLSNPVLDEEGNPTLLVIVPLADTGADHLAVIIEASLEKMFFNLLKTWPIPSTSSETLLFRRDEDDVLCINQLRHQEDTALKLRLPVQSSSALAARTLRNPEELGILLNGFDYRSERVLGIVRDIPGTDWFLVAKTDKSEIYSMASANVAWIILSGLLVLFLSSAAAYAHRQNQELTLIQGTRKIQEEKLNALQLLDAVTQCSSDAIYIKDTEGRYKLLNTAAARYIGKAVEEVLGKDDQSIFLPEEAAAIMANDQSVMESRKSYTFDEIVSTAGNTITFLATKSPMFDANGNVTGILGISRDISKRKKTENALRLSEEKFRNVVESFPMAMYFVRLDEADRLIFIEANPSFDRILGISGEDYPGKPIEEVFPNVVTTDIPDMFKKVALGTIGTQNFETEYRDNQVGGFFEVVVFQTAPRTIAIVFSEITERKSTEHKIQQQMQELQHWYEVTLGREERVLELKKEADELRQRLGESARYTDLENDPLNEIQ